MQWRFNDRYSVLVARSVRIPPDANIAVATGRRSGVVVIDVDDDHGKSGSATLAGLERKHGRLPDTLTCVTGGGRHLYFAYPGCHVGSTSGVVGDGLDVRADGGYVIVPPSQHYSGAVCHWNDPAVPIAELPGWLLALMLKKPVTTAPAKASAPTTALVPVGCRNTELTRTAGKLRARGMDANAIKAELLKVNATSLQRPLPIEEVNRISDSMSRYPRGSYAPSLPWFPFYTSDWLAMNAVRFGKDFQRGWLINLLSECWRRGGVLPADLDILWQLAGASSKAAFERNNSHLLCYPNSSAHA